MNDPILDILDSEYLEPSGRVKSVCQDIAARHPGRVQAFIYYGSSLRDMDNPEKMLDFYVIVDSYRKTHRNPLRALLNAIIPPAVYYHEMDHSDGVTTTCKYSIMSIKAFERRCGGSAFLSVTWGRFSQPCIVLFPASASAQNRIQSARVKAVRHMAKQTAPLFDSPVDNVGFWARGFRESYRTELRPESSEARSREIVERYEERYKDIMAILFGRPDKAGNYDLSPMNGSGFWARFKWFGRRLIGKPVGGIRVLNSALTFDGGLDYVQRKLENHSGVRIDVTESQRRHPILWSPILAWKYWRKGAFR